ncbi:MAG: hypothetical protein LAO78_17825 [Acidobacteriia bacterium]|nr:hypothetical protein [Terriglobia bacterium]
MKHLEQLFGTEWVERLIKPADSQHPLALWNRQANNLVGRYADDLADFILNSGLIKCDSIRLASKLKADFAETLGEMGYAVFLGRQGFHVAMEPFAPKAGPDLCVARDKDYFVEIRKVGLDEARASADSATEEIFARLCKVPSRFSILISMTEDFGAYSSQLKRATKRVGQMLKDLTERNVKKATLYHYGPEDNSIVVEGAAAEPTFDYTDSEKLKAQIKQADLVERAPFVARFDDTGSENDHTAVAVHPLGSDPKLLKPDKTHLRLRGILHQKREQLPKAGPGIIVLDLSDLEKLGIGQEALMSALYGDMQITFRVGNERQHFESEVGHRRNGFFGQTTRVSAVVMEKTKISAEIEITRDVYPTNNSNAVLLAQSELECFGNLASDFVHLCGPAPHTEASGETPQ